MWLTYALSTDLRHRPVALHNRQIMLHHQSMGMGQAGLIGMGQVVRLILASTILAHWEKSDVHSTAKKLQRIRE